MKTITDPIDVWLRFEHDEDEEPTHEANTYRNADGTYRIEHYHVEVGQVSTIEFDTLEEAHEWYAAQGFQDSSS